MMRRIGKGEAQGIIAWHPDRLARNSVDGGQLIYLLDNQKLIDLKFATFTFENNPQGKFMLSIIFSYSKYYVDALSENVKRGNRTKIENGWLPGLAATGYVNNQETKTIQPDPERFPLLRRMWELMLTGIYTPRKILEQANTWGFKTRLRKRSGGKPLTLSAVYRIFTNPFYAGILEHGGKTYPGKHTPIVTVDEFDQVQKILGKRGQPRYEKHQLPYTGMIRCGECGFSITGETKTNRHGTHYTYYHCTKRRLDFRCGQPYLTIEELEKQIVAFLQSISISDGFHELFLKYVKQLAEECNATARHQNLSIEKARLDVARQLDNLTKMRMRELISDDQFLRQQTELERERIKLSQRIESWRSSESWVDPARLFLSFRTDTVSYFRNGNAQARNLTLETVGSNFVLMDQKLSIDAKKPFRLIEGTPTLSLVRGLVEEVRTLWESQDPEFVKIMRKIRTLSLFP